PEKVVFPEGYQTDFVRFTAVNKPAGRGPARVRFVYVNRDALAKAVPGKPAPQGTILVAEDYKAKLGSDGKPMKDRIVKFIPSGAVTNLFVQEKRVGWGAEYPAEKRNGEWEYAWFEGNGARKANAKFGRCFACHKDDAADEDYTFTFMPFVQAVKR
ncbi:MAG: cytochrome P460 family protein, partial [Proteobacteria bacterium]|nr:cytochrome P460 family protein [Pseudomonadota bacterium]